MTTLAPELVATAVLLYVVTTSQMIYQNYDYEQEQYLTPICPVCETPECVSTASRIIEYLDQNLDPCDDFYQFACGGWIKNQVLPPNMQLLLTLYDITKNLAAARNVLKAETKPSELSSIRKARDLYASCLQNAGHNIALSEILDALKVRFRDWSSVMEWKEYNMHDSDLRSCVSQALRLQVFALFQLSVAASGDFADDGKLYTSHIIVVKQPHLEFTLKGGIIANNTTIEAYTKRVLDTVAKLNIEDQDAVHIAKEIIEVEIKLAQLFIDSKDDKDKNYTLREMDESFGKLLDWTDFVTTFASSPETSVTDITPDEIVTVTVPKYLSRMTEYFTALPKRIQENYIIWQTVVSLYKDITTDTDSTVIVIQEDENVEDSKSQTVVRSEEETCVIYVSKVFSLVLHRLLYTEMFSPEEIVQTQELMRNIQQEFDRVVEEHDWVDEKTAYLIKKKNSALVTTYVSFEKAMNDTFLESYYSEIQFGNISFLEKRLIIREHAFLHNLRLLRMPFEIFMGELPYMVVGRNTMFQNSIDFSAAIFEPPVFTRNIPQSLNYGGLGFVFAHEVLHAFDNVGYTMNAEGAKGNWWSKKTVAVFHERSRCLIDQYNKFFLETAQLHINGTLTLGNNIADNDGLKLAYRAYRQNVAGKEEELRLPGLHFSHDQLFFINFAQIWCSVESKETDIKSVKSSRHSPSKFRVIGATQNSEDFARAFSCPVGSYMNPEKKCKVEAADILMKAHDSQGSILLTMGYKQYWYSGNT